MAGQSNKHLFTCNHDEADTRVVLHACLKDANRVVVSRYTVVFVLMVFVFAFKNTKRFWSKKIGHNKYINIGKVVKYLGIDLALKLPHIHAITGCDTTSFLLGK